MILMIVLAVALGYSLVALAATAFVSYRLQPVDPIECLACSGLGTLWPMLFVIGATQERQG